MTTTQHCKHTSYVYGLTICYNIDSINEHETDHVLLQNKNSIISKPSHLGECLHAHPDFASLWSLLAVTVTAMDQWCAAPATVEKLFHLQQEIAESRKVIQVMDSIFSVFPAAPPISSSSSSLPPSSSSPPTCILAMLNVGASLLRICVVALRLAHKDKGCASLLPSLEHGVNAALWILSHSSLAPSLSIGLVATHFLTVCVRFDNSVRGTAANTALREVDHHAIVETALQSIATSRRLPASPALNSFRVGLCVLIASATQGRTVTLEAEARWLQPLVNLFIKVCVPTKKATEAETNVISSSQRQAVFSALASALQHSASGKRALLVRDDDIMCSYPHHRLTSIAHTVINR